MNWPQQQKADEVWGRTITNRQQKAKVASQMAQQLTHGDEVGIGSGATSFLTLNALAARRDKDGLAFQAIATSLEMELVCAALDIPVVSLRRERPDW